MVVHFVHNGLLMMVLYYQDRLDFLGDGFDNQTHLPIEWIGEAGLILAVGAGLVWIGSRESQANVLVEP